MKQTFQINVNGKAYEVNAEPDRTLLDVLREDLRLTGTKRGCDIGLCGTCTVLIDGKPKRSCIVKVSMVGVPLLCKEGLGEVDRDLPHPSSPYTEILIQRLMESGAEFRLKDPLEDKGEGHLLITTIEGLSKDGKLHPIQQAFIDCGAIQCGFCTPGMVLTARALLDKNPNPTREEIRKAMAANLCRCTGYQQIVDAIEEAAKRINRR